LGYKEKFIKDYSSNEDASKVLTKEVENYNIEFWSALNIVFKAFFIYLGML